MTITTHVFTGATATGSDTFKLRLVNGYTFNAAHLHWSDVSAYEIAGGNGYYTVGGYTLTGVSLVYGSPNYTFKAANVTTPLSTVDNVVAFNGFIIVDTTDDSLIAYVDLGASYSANLGENFYIPFGAAGIEWNNSGALVASTVDFFKISVMTYGHAAYPTTHLENANQLNAADAIVELFQITLIDHVTVLYLKNDNSVTWRGNDYEGTAISLTGVSQSGDDQTARPQLLLFNPEGVFNSLVDAGSLDGAIVARYRVLKDHLENNYPVYRRQQWKISRIASMKGNTIACEMRDMLDGQVFMVPARMYIPPEFPAVSLQ